MVGLQTLIRYWISISSDVSYRGWCCGIYSTLFSWVMSMISKAWCLVRRLMYSGIVLHHWKSYCHWKNVTIMHGWCLEPQVSVSQCHLWYFSHLCSSLIWIWLVNNLLLKNGLALFSMSELLDPAVWTFTVFVSWKMCQNRIILSWNNMLQHTAVM